MLRVVLPAIAGALLLAGTTTAAPSARPQLRIVDMAPLTVRGAHFETGEAVTVTAVARGAVARGFARSRRLTRTGTAGGFTVSLPALEIEGCAAVVVTAVGASGDHATAKIVPECPAP